MFHPKGPTFLELAKQALSSTTEGYDMLAPKFEYTPFRTPDVLVRKLAEVAANRPMDDVLDLACGTGALARALAPKVEHSALGIDISEGMIEEAKKLAKEEGVDATFQVMNLFDMRFNEQFDAVVTSGAFGHILEPEQPQFVDLIWKALRPGGRFLFWTTPMPSATEPVYWAARGFNAAMHVRNVLVQPPFIMFYLTFTLERASELLWKRGFEVKVESPFEKGDYARARLVIATKPDR